MNKTIAALAAGAVLTVAAVAVNHSDDPAALPDGGAPQVQVQAPADPPAAPVVPPDVEAFVQSWCARDAGNGAKLVGQDLADCLTNARAGHF